MATVTFGGINSGLPPNLVDQLIEAERAPIKNLEKKKDNGLLLIPIERIFRDENQPRKEFDKDKIEELPQSINKNGLIQPLIVTKKDSENYTLVAGERRWRASQLAGLPSIPAYVREADDQGMLEMALLENIQRADLNPLEVAISYQRLIDDSCAQCGNLDLMTLGSGTQRIEEILSNSFPEAKIQRVDRDTMKSKNKLDKLYQDMIQGNIDILVGTQMLSKGL